MTSLSQSNLSPKDRLILATDMIKDCVVSCFRELVRSEGSERVLSAIAPHCINGGFAASMIIKERMALQNNDPLSIAIVWSFLHHTFRRKPDVVLGRDYCIFHVNRCSHLDGGHEICMLQCVNIGRGVAKSFSGDIEFDMTSSIADHDQYCTQVFKPKSLSASKVDNEISKVYVKENLVPIDEEEALAYYHAYLSEMLLYIFRASNDLSGSDRTFHLFQEKMYNLGSKWGHIIHRTVSKAGDHELDLAELMEVVNNLLHQKGGPIIRMSNMAMREIEVCPFSSAPPEVCKLFQEFMNGVVVAVDASYRFTYQETMNAGSTKCIWMLNKKPSVKK